jgi:hypothetical protein
MTAAPYDVDPAEAMLAELAGLDLSLARHVHACATSTDDPGEVADLARAYQRVARSVRQSLALHARLKRDREQAAREAPAPPPAPPPPPPTPARDAARIAARKDALRPAAQRVVWAEYEDAEDEDLCGYYLDLVEERLQLRGRDNAFGLVARDQAWDIEPLDDHVVRFCADMGLPAAAARLWRDLPDPPPEALLPPDDDDAPDPAWKSSA